MSPKHPVFEPPESSGVCAAARIKLLCFDGTGTWLATKRLEAGTFSGPAPPAPGQRKIRLAPEALRLLLDGVNMRGARFRPWYQRES